MTKKVKNSIINRELTFPIKIGSHNITASPGDSVISAFYYNKKHYGFIFALFVCGWSFIKSLYKILFFSITGNNFKKKIYLNRASGYINSMLGKKSWYRPKIF